jgi:hypothetical protein
MYDEMTRAWSSLLHRTSRLHEVHDERSHDSRHTGEQEVCLMFHCISGIQEKASDKEGLAYEGICWEFTTPCFVLLTLRLICPLCCFCIIVISSELALRFYFFILLASPQEVSTVMTTHDTKRPLLYTTTPPNFTKLDDKIPKERHFEWATTRL